MTSKQILVLGGNTGMSIPIPHSHTDTNATRSNTRTSMFISRLFSISSSTKLPSAVRAMSLFTQVLNPMTGQSDWVSQCDDYDYHQEVARAAFADMLHDTERNQKYFAALKKTIKNLHAVGKEAHVLDIGTGTGILSMMAVQCGADSVTACEAFLPMARCAVKIMEANGMKEKIHLISKRSTEIVVGQDGDMSRRANVLVTEVFDTELIGEGAIGIFNHAHKVLLTDDCIVIPSLSTVYAQVVESSIASSWNKPKLIPNLDGEVLLTTPTEIGECVGEAGVHDIQLSQLSTSQFKPITDAVEIFKFDFNTTTPISTDQISNLKVIAKNQGSTHAVFFWWDLNMDVEGEIVLSCAPYWEHPDFNELLKENDSNTPTQNCIPWRDHWMQALYYIPLPKVLNSGQEFILNSNYDEYSFWFDIWNTNDAEKTIARHTCNCSFHMAYSRTRIGQLNQSLRNKKYLRVFEENIDQNSKVLSISDGSLVGLATAKLGAKSVQCLETFRYSSDVLEAYVKHNKIDNVRIVKSLENVELLEEVTHVVAEPYFVSSIVPWDNFYFGKLLTSIIKRLPENVKVYPVEAKMYAVPVEFLDLHKIRTPLGICEGFDLTIFDKFVDSASNLADANVEAQPLWEYPCRALGKPQELMCVEFKNYSEPKNSSGTISIDKTASCNGIAVWVDWNIDGGRSPKSIVSTGPTYPIETGKIIDWDMFVRQGVHLIPNPVDVVEGKNSLQWSIAFKPLEGDLKFKFNII